MEWYETIFEIIDMRSFSNLWYWIALATVWSMASHYVVGVPYDMVSRASRNAQAQADLETLVAIRVRRIEYIVRVSGVWLVALVTMALATLATLAIWYNIEFAQALGLIVLPMTVVGALSIRTADRIYSREITGEALRRTLSRHRLAVQVIGMLSVFVTAMWGMFRNLYVGPLGG